MGVVGQERYNEMVNFRLFQMPCCGHQLCWVNPRVPSYCPECGVFVLRSIKECVKLSDDVAWLRYKVPK